MKLPPTDASGQAIFELIIFLPVLLILYVVITTLGNAVNGAINQQKIVRNYLFNYVRNDSNFPNVEILASIRDGGNVTSIGLFAIGWRFAADGKTPIAPCYKVMSLSNEVGRLEKCSNSDQTSKGQWIRVKSVFGICPATYAAVNQTFQEASQINSLGVPSAAYSSCTNL